MRPPAVLVAGRAAIGVLVLSVWTLGVTRANFLVQHMRR